MKYVSIMRGVHKDFWHKVFLSIWKYKGAFGQYVLFLIGTIEEDYIFGKFESFS